MLERINNCSYKYRKKCTHPVYKDGFCIFHHPDIEGKKDLFHKALEDFIKKCESDDRIRGYDFTGFQFPEISFVNKKFIKYTDFSGSIFSGVAIFDKNTFSGDAYFNGSKFSGYTIFIGSTFSRDAIFSRSKFSGDTYFRGSKFSRDAYFKNIKFFRDSDFSENTFSEFAYFTGSKFSRKAYFRESRFLKDAVFIGSAFSGYTDFKGSIFSRDAVFIDNKFFNNTDFIGTFFYNKTDFSGTVFRSFINFNESYIKMLKDINGQGINFERTVIEESVFWNINELEGYSFKNSFLLSISFADKELINCDFTGAVLDAVRTRGWKPDEATVSNTKYIYTDYEIEMELDENGLERKNYKAKEESRIPADGNFGEGDNIGFTIRDYLLEPYKWSYALNAPSVLRTAVINYVHFFTDFIRTTEGKDIEFNTKREGNKIRVEFSTGTKEDKVLLDEKFKEYVNNINKRFEDIKFDFRNPAVSDIEKSILISDYKAQIAILQNKVETTELLYNQQKEFLEYIKDFKINPQGIFIEHKQDIKKALFFCLKADLKGFSNFMKDGRGIEISKLIKNICNKNAVDCKYYEAKEGDSIFILHSDVNEIIKAAFRINEDLKDKNEAFLMRFGIDCGEIAYEELNDNFDPLTSPGLRLVARIEPVVFPGQIWCTERVKAFLDDKSVYKAVKLKKSDINPLERLNGKDQVNIKKEGSPEPDEFITLFKIVMK